MTLIDRIDTALILRRAARKAAKAKAEKAARDHLNRPHVQSVHQIGWWIAPPAPTARDMGITPSYVALLLVLVCAVVYLNLNPQAVQAYSCSTHIASNTGANK